MKLQTSKTVKILQICIVLIFVSCSEEPTNIGTYKEIDWSFTPQLREDDWEIIDPEEVGLDINKLADAYDEASNKWFLYSLLVVKNGKLVAEQYFNDQDWDDANHVHSVSKSFTATLIGIAMREGYLSNLDQKLMDFFPEYSSTISDSLKFDITIEHLLTMRAGFEWLENEEHWLVYWSSTNWVKYALNLPLNSIPGEQFNYASPQTNLLSAILTEATSMSTKAFAQQFLFSPLQITIGYWLRDPQGYYTGGHEMYFIPRNLARFGLLYLNNGMINGNQIVPSEWIEKSTESYSRSSWDWGILKQPHYGYQWWTGELNNLKIIFASGKGGQFIINVPSKNMVIVTTTNADAWENSWAQLLETLDLIAFVLSSLEV